MSSNASAINTMRTSFLDTANDVLQDPNRYFDLFTASAFLITGFALHSGFFLASFTISVMLSEKIEDQAEAIKNIWRKANFIQKVAVFAGMYYLPPPVTFISVIGGLYLGLYQAKLHRVHQPPAIQILEAQPDDLIVKIAKIVVSCLISVVAYNLNPAYCWGSFIISFIAHQYVQDVINKIDTIWSNQHFLIQGATLFFTAVLNPAPYNGLAISLIWGAFLGKEVRYQLV